MDKYKTKVLTQGSISSLESSIKSFLEEIKPITYSVSVFYDSVSNSSSKYTAVIVYNQ